MKLVYGLIFLGFFQSVACEMFDQQVQALFEVKMMLNDSRGVLEDWRSYYDTACGTISTVACDPEGKYVVEIDLSSSGLSGVLSPSIAKLTTLQRLFLDDNNITGGIPQEIGNLSSLTTLKLENNQFNGSISDSIGRLSELQILDLSENLLSGNIPIALSNIPSLEYINLAYNNLSGEIPKQLHASLYNYTGNHLNCGPHSMSCEGNTNNTGGSGTSIIKVVLISIVVAIVVVAMCVLMCVLISRRMPCRCDLSSDVPDEHALSLDHGPTQQFSLGHLMNATRDFGTENFLGKGSFVEVYKGVLPGQDNKVVFIKKLVEGENHRDDMAFKREAEVISVVVHKNLLKLLGYCMAPMGRFLVYPFMEKSLSSSLEGSNPDEPTLDWTTRMKIALGVARGLEYLHDNFTPPIIHGDIKAANVLLDGDFEAVLGDFGLANLMDQGKEIMTTVIQGTVGYMAPEYRSTGKASMETDIYGYGVLMLELVTGKGPDFHVNVEHLLQESGPEEIVEQESGLEEIVEQESGLEEIVDSNLDHAYQREEVVKLIKIYHLCTREKPDLRPTISEIVKFLEGEVPQDRLKQKLDETLANRRSENEEVQQHQKKQSYNLQNIHQLGASISEESSSSRNVAHLDAAIPSSSSNEPA